MKIVTRSAAIYTMNRIRKGSGVVTFKAAINGVFGTFLELIHDKLRTLGLDVYDFFGCNQFTGECGAVKFIFATFTHPHWPAGVSI
jgi:hypothetical protein